MQNLIQRSHSTSQSQRVNTKQPAVDMSRVACIILGGGQGSRLHPLTASRCKPAMSFGGRYLLIDIPISNSLNSDCHKIFILTQFLSASLHRHIFRTYHLDTFSSGFIEVLTAEQKPNASSWFQGTADAVRQNLEYLIETPVDYYLILSGDQLYSMDYRHMMQFAIETDADLVIAAQPATKQEAKRMGILKVNQHAFITDFVEKPQEEAVLEEFKVSPYAFEKFNLIPDPERTHIGSMGIYLFKRETLINLLKNDPREDFGKHLIPKQVASGKTAAYLFDGYWEDIGTIESFYNANIALTKPHPPINLYDPANPIYSARLNLPGPKIHKAEIEYSIICEGSVIEASSVTNSILGPRTVIQKGTVIKNSYLMGNEFYYPPVRDTHRFPNELHIGKNCRIEGAIIDKNVRIGNDVKLINENKLSTYSSEHIYIRDGVIIVPCGANLPDGFTL